jgi:hypothetical protein
VRENQFYFSRSADNSSGVDKAARLLSTLLPCAPANHVTIRNRTHRVAAEIEAKSPEAPRDVRALSDEIVVMIDGAHIRAAPGYQSRHLDVTVGKVEVSGRRPRRFALAPKRIGSSVDSGAHRSCRTRLAAWSSADGDQ